MDTLLIVLVMGLCNVACVLVGYVAGSAGRKDGEKPSFHPVEKIREHRENKELQQEQRQRQEAVKTMMHNIDVYDGTDAGQQEVNYWAR